MRRMNLADRLRLWATCVAISGFGYFSGGCETTNAQRNPGAETAMAGMGLVGLANMSRTPQGAVMANALGQGLMAHGNAQASRSQITQTTNVYNPPQQKPRITATADGEEIDITNLDLSRKSNAPFFLVHAYDDKNRNGGSDDEEPGTFADNSGIIYRETGLMIFPNADEFGGRKIYVRVWRLDGGQELINKEVEVPKGRVVPHIPYTTNLALINIYGRGIGARDANDIARYGTNGEGAPLNQDILGIEFGLVVGYRNGKRLLVEIPGPFKDNKIHVRPNDATPAIMDDLMRRKIEK